MIPFFYFPMERKKGAPRGTPFIRIIIERYFYFFNSRLVNTPLSVETRTIYTPDANAATFTLALVL